MSEDFDPLKEYLKEKCDEIEVKSEKDHEEDSSKFKIKFASSFIDSFAKCLNKDPEVEAREEREAEQEMLEYLRYYLTTHNTLNIFSTGVLSDEPLKYEDIKMEGSDDDFLKQIGYRQEEGTWYFNSSWTDIHFELGVEKYHPWMAVVQTQDCFEGHQKFEVEFNNEQLEKAFKKKNLEDIKYYQEEVSKLQFPYENTFREVTVGLEFTRLNKDAVIAGARVWLSIFLPEVDISSLVIKYIEQPKDFWEREIVEEVIKVKDEYIKKNPIS